MSYKIRMICLKFSFALGFVLLFQPVFSQASKKNKKEFNIESYAELDGVVQQYQKPLGGNFVSMLWTDTVKYKREAGDFDSRTQVPIKDASKWLTAALVLKFVEEGKISLDDKVGKYLPIFDTYGKSYITIRHCLSHFTGVQPMKKRSGSLEEEVESYAKQEIITNPGTEFSYSDVGPNIAGRILEIITKKKFDMLAKQKLFNPLAMHRTTFGTLDGSEIDPSSGASSSADEYMHFLVMLLNNGKYNGQQVLSEASVQELRRIYTKNEQVKSSPKTTEGLNYALGSWVVDENSRGDAAALAGAGIYGMWPMVDWCRGYAFLVITKTPQAEQKKEQYVQMKEAIDDKMKNGCK